MSNTESASLILSWADSPLQALLTRYREHQTYAKVELGVPEDGEADWVAAADFVHAEVADQPIRRVMTKYEATETVAGTYSFRSFISLPLQVMAYGYATERRVPIIADNLLYNNRESLYHIALREPRVVVIEGDSWSTLPGVRTVADEAALKAALFEQVAWLLEPTVAAWGSRKLVNRNNAWASALDALAYGFQSAGKHELTLDESWQQFEQLYAERSFPSRRRPVRFQYEVDGEADEMVVRAGCCLWYMLPSMRASEYKYCTSCYLETDEMRLQKLTEWKRRQAAEKQAA